MNIEDLTIKQARELAGIFGSNPSTSHAFPVGANVLVRCVTLYYTGRLVEVTAGELVLEDAAWIASTGRFTDALMSGEFSEVEPYPDGGRVVLGRGAVLDVSVIKSLPTAQK